MFVCRLNIEVSFQSAVDEQYVNIKKGDFAVGEGTGEFDLTPVGPPHSIESRVTSWVMGGGK